MKTAYIVFNNPRFHYLHKTWVDSVEAEFLESPVFSSKSFFAKTILSAFKNRNKYHCLISVGGSGLQLSALIKIFNPKIKLIYLNIDPLFYELKNKNFLKRKYIQFLASRIDGIISNSNLVNEYAKKYTNCKNFVVEPFVKQTKFKKDKKTVNKLTNLVFLGRLSKEKNTNIALKAFEIVKNKFPKLSLHIIGDGPLKDKLSNTNAKDITFTGYLPNPSEILSKCRIMLQPSTFESFCLSVFEGILAGNVPIVTKNMGVAEYLPKELIIGSPSEAELAEKIEHLLNKGDKYLKNLNKKLQAVVKKFTKKKSISQFKKAFEALNNG